MKRREFITLLGGAAAAWPLAARAQQARADAAHRRALARSRGRSGMAGPRRGVPAGAAAIGLDDGRNVRIDTRWAAGERRRDSQTRGGIGRARAGRHPGRMAPRPSGRCCRRPAPCRSCSRSSPIRSAPASSTAWRGRAATPPASCRFEYSIEREMAGAAQADRAGRDASGGPSGCHHHRRIGQFGAIQAVAPSLGMEVSPINVRDAGEIERAVDGIRALSNGGLIVTASALARRSSRSDHRAGGPAQAARGLLRSPLRHQRRPDLLWA